MKNPIIGLHGNPRVGKGTLAGLLVGLDGFACIGFADRLYEEVARAFGVTVAQLQQDDWKSTPQPALALYHCMDDCFYNLMYTVYAEDAQAPRTSRWILQRWGTEYRRAQNPRYWINIVEQFVQDHEKQPVVLHDVRFEDEAKLGLLLVLRRQRSGQGIIEITRKNAPPPDSHTSNRRLPDHLIDFTVANDGTPEEMYQAVINEMGSKWKS